jgi:histidine triad (HIT) family protein
MSDCPFCDYAGPSPVLADYGGAFIIEPLNPVTPGHLLAVTKGHYADALEAPDMAARVVVAAIDYANLVDVGACNVILNSGEMATQTIRHLHAHLVPRVAGDGLPLPWTHLHPHGEEGLELLSARFHDIYQKEAHRRGDVRHQDAYEDLPEATKEWDRVLARWVLEHWAPRFGSSGELPPP